MSNAKHYRDKNVLITGGLGFIGSSLARCLVQQNANVTLVDSLIPEYGGNRFNIQGLDNRVLVNISDMRDRYSLRYLVKNKDYIFNLAGQTSHLDSMENPFADIDINSVAQLSLLETCRRFNSNVKIVFASTRQIYGRPHYLPVDEKHESKPVDINGINKLAGEQFHLLYNNVYNIRCCVLRLTNTYGPRMRVKDARQTFLGLWIRNATQGNYFEVWEGSQLRDFTYVDDVVKAFLLVATHEDTSGRIYNLGGDCVISLLELAKCLTRLTKGHFKIKEFPEKYKQIDIGNYYSDFSLIKSTLGWKPKVGLEEGLVKTIAFYKKYLKHYL